MKQNVIECLCGDTVSGAGNRGAKYNGKQGDGAFNTQVFGHEFEHLSILTFIFEWVFYSKSLIMGRLQVVILPLCECPHALHSRSILLSSFNLIAQSWLSSVGQCYCTYCDLGNGPGNTFFSPGSGVILALTEF